MAKDIRFNVRLNVDGKEVLVDCKEGVRDLGKALGTIPSQSEMAGKSFAALGGISTVVRNTYDAISGLTGQMQQYIDKANSAAESQVKLRTIMSQRMSATEQDIASINKLIGKQTELGVVGGTVQRAGMQQLATFASQRSTLETLLPAMNNLLVQQNGLNSTTESAVGVANLMGKALMGNAGALTRVGITLTDHQKELIKTGDEYTRAKTLAEAITQNVGEMNAEMAKTDAGKAKKAANEFTGLQTRIGALLAPYQTLITKFGQIGFAITGVTQLTTSMRTLGVATGASSAISKMYVGNLLSMQLSMGGASTAATVAAGAITALKVAIRGALIASGVGLAIAGLTTAIEALTSAWNSGSNSAEKMTESEKKQSEEALRAAQRQKGVSETISRAVNSLAVKYQFLQAQWKALKTDHERNAWIKKNQSAFGELGLSVNGVNDAYNYFVKNSDKVVAALKAIAEARAWEDIYKDDLKKLNEYDRQPGTVDNGKYYTVHKAGEKVEDQTKLPFSWARAGLRPGDYEKRSSSIGHYTYELTDKGASKLNATEKADAKTRRENGRRPLVYNLKKSEDAMNQKQKNAMDLSSAVGIDMNGNPTTTTTASDRGNKAMPTVSRRNSTDSTSYNDKDKTLTLIGNPVRQQDYKNNIDYYDQEIAKLNAGNDADKEKIANLNKQKAKVQEILDLYDKLGKKEEEPSTPTAPEYEQGSIDDYAARVRNLDERLRSVNLSEEARNRLMRERIGLQAVADAKQLSLPSADGSPDNTDYTTLLAGLEQRRKDILASMNTSLTMSAPTIDGSGGLDFDINVEGMDDLVEVSHLIDQIRGKKKEADKEQTESNLISQWGGDMVSTMQNIKGIKEAFGSAGSTAATAGAAIALAGQQLQQLSGQGEAAKVGAIASALGQLALGFAYATSEAGKKLGPWGWVAFGLAGLAQLISMVNTVKSFATGGIVPGTSYTGDKVVAHVNSGEMILNARQQARLFAIANGGIQPVVTLPVGSAANAVELNVGGVQGGGVPDWWNVEFRLRGRDLVGSVANTTRTASKAGKRSNIII